MAFCSPTCASTTPARACSPSSACRRSPSAGRTVARSCPAVVLDDAPGVVAAVEHLVDLGHRRIAFVSGPDQFLHSRHRLRRLAFDARAPRPPRGARSGRRLRRRERSGGHGRTAGPAGAPTTDRDRVRQRPDGHRRVVGGRPPGPARPRRPVDRRVRRHRRRRAHAPGAHDRGPRRTCVGPRRDTCGVRPGGARTSTTTGSCPLLGSSSGARPRRSHAARRPAPARRPTVRRQQPTDPRRPAGRDQPGGNHETFNESSSRCRGPQPHGDGCRPRRQRRGERPAGVAGPDRRSGCPTTPPSWPGATPWSTRGTPTIPTRR